MKITDLNYSGDLEMFLKHARFVAMAMSFFATTIFSSAAASDGCDNTAVAESAPAQYEEFLGELSGEWKGDLAATLVVSEITADGSAVACYSWGSAIINGFPVSPGTVHNINGLINGDTITVHSPGAVMKFTHTGNGAFDGHWQGTHNNSTGSFTRADE